MGNDVPNGEVRDEIREIIHYLDDDSRHRQSTTVVRLTVIPIRRPIATVTTGYSGINIIPYGDGNPTAGLLHGLVATSVSVAPVPFPVTLSKRRSDFLESLSDERLDVGRKVRTFGSALRRRKD